MIAFLTGKLRKQIAEIVDELISIYPYIGWEGIENIWKWAYIIYGYPLK